MATFTLEQVQAHNKKDDLWIVLHNKGKLAQSHPKGDVDSY